MTKKRALELLADCLTPDTLANPTAYIQKSGDETVAFVDGLFSPEQLEAIAWWIRRHAGGAK